MVIRIEPYRAGEHLTGLCDLMNRHIGSIVPGWTLTPRFVDQRLGDNPEQPVLNPWVVERATLCAVADGTVVAAAHLLRYGTGPEVSADYHGIATIAWVLSLPEHHTTGAEILRQARARMRAWGARLQAADFDLAGIIDGAPTVGRTWRPPCAQSASGRAAGSTAATRCATDPCRPQARLPVRLSRDSASSAGSAPRRPASPCSTARRRSATANLPRSDTRWPSPCPRAVGRNLRFLG